MVTRRKNRLASWRVIGSKPSSSMSSSAVDMYLHRFSRTGGRPASIFSAVISSSKRKYCTEKPCSTARIPRPTHRCVLPTPGGPWIRTVSRVWLQSGRGRWNDVTDDQSVLLDNDPIDDQPEDFLLGLKRRVDERIPNAVTERLQPLQQPKLLLTPRALTSDRVEPGL